MRLLPPALVVVLSCVVPAVLAQPAASAEKAERVTRLMGVPDMLELMRSLNEAASRPAQVDAFAAQQLQQLGVPGELTRQVAPMLDRATRGLSATVDSDAMNGLVSQALALVMTDQELTVVERHLNTPRSRQTLERMRAALRSAASQARSNASPLAAAALAGAPGAGKADTADTPRKPLPARKATPPLSAAASAPAGAASGPALAAASALPPDLAALEPDLRALMMDAVGELKRVLVETSRSVARGAQQR